MKIAIMTDTNSGMSVDEGKENGIFVIPMPVIVNDKEYMEGEDITHAELYRELISGSDVKTSLPSPAHVMDMWDELLEDHDSVVYIPMSSALSSSVSVSRQFAEEYDGKVQVVDNHRISVTLKDSVFDAKKMADEGMDAVAIKEKLEEEAFNQSIYITVNTLSHLVKSGRVTAAGAMIATAINIKPVLTIQGEKLDAFAKVRGMKSAETKMIESLKNDLLTRFKDYPKENLRLHTAGTLQTEEEAEAWLTKVKDAFPGYQVDYDPLSCSIACHVSVDTKGIGVAVIKK